jgi:hypothetical protein
MSWHVHVPAAPVGHFVDLFWIYENYAPPHAQERLLPMGRMSLVITFNRTGTVWSGVSGSRTE